MNVAWPLAFSVADWAAPPSTLKVTLPVGVGTPACCGLTVTVTVPLLL